MDLEKGAAESDEAAAAQDAITVGMCLGGLLLVADLTILLIAGPQTALVTTVLFAPLVLLVMWDVRRTGPYRDEDVGQGGDGGGSSSSKRAA
jgi:predicted lipid-binding transport protein (Tim44 family)